MKCPACNNELSHIDESGVEVDICRGGCGGVWFDTYEFKKFDEPHEEAGQELLNVEIDPTISVDHREKRKCPHCKNITMMRHYFSVKKAIEIDECAGCGGIWLDMGELGTIRSLFGSEEEKSAAAAEVFDELFGPKLTQLKDERAKDSTKARRIANMFKYICPSYYISGDQDWGAF